MTTPEPGAPAPAPGRWAQARPELIIATAGVSATALAALAVLGPAAAALVLIIAGIAALVTLRALALPGIPPPPLDEASPAGVVRSFTGLFRKQSELTYGTSSLSAYDLGLRVTLQRLLAARLSERHGISLHDDPDAARRLLCAGQRGDGLWFWIDPARPPAQDDRPRSGIPPRTLALLIDRLERL